MWLSSLLFRSAGGWFGSFCLHVLRCPSDHDSKLDLVVGAAIRLVELDHVPGADQPGRKLSLKRSKGVVGEDIEPPINPDPSPGREAGDEG